MIDLDLDLADAVLGAAALIATVAAYWLGRFAGEQSAWDAAAAYWQDRWIAAELRAFFLPARASADADAAAGKDTDALQEISERSPAAAVLPDAAGPREGVAATRSLHPFAGPSAIWNPRSMS